MPESKRVLSSWPEWFELKLYAEILRFLLVEREWRVCKSRTRVLWKKKKKHVFFSCHAVTACCLLCCSCFMLCSNLVLCSVSVLFFSLFGCYRRPVPGNCKQHKPATLSQPAAASGLSPLCCYYCTMWCSRYIFIYVLFFRRSGVS